MDITSLWPRLYYDGGKGAEVGEEKKIHQGLLTVFSPNKQTKSP